jgi:hypothetical protein
MKLPDTTATNDGADVVFSGHCTVTGKAYSVRVPSHQVFKWYQGALIQDAMPDLSPGDREFLVSGISPAGWDQLFRESGGDEVS